MRPVKSRDLRVTKTLESIRAAFLSLVSEMPYDDITISALCLHARIGRKTFYAYYSSLDELSEEIMEEIPQDYLETIKPYDPPVNMLEITRKFYEFSTSAGPYYNRVICSESYQKICRQMIMRFVRGTWVNAEWFQKLPQTKQEILLCFVYNSGLSLYRHWIMAGKPIPLDRMILYASTLLAQGIDGFS